MRLEGKSRRPYADVPWRQQDSERTEWLRLQRVGVSLTGRKEQKNYAGERTRKTGEGNSEKQPVPQKDLAPVQRMPRKKSEAEEGIEVQHPRDSNRSSRGASNGVAG